MIYPITMYAGKCDNCGEEIKLGGGEYSAYAEKECVEEEMADSDYHIVGDKHYCPDCWSYDDEDKIVLRAIEQPKLTAEQIVERKEAIEWYRNPASQSAGTVDNQLVDALTWLLPIAEERYKDALAKAVHKQFLEDTIGEKLMACRDLLQTIK